jgi:uncharacterized membrane protein YGL010W
MTVNRSYQFVCVITLILSVVVVFVSPMVNLEPTALRAARAALALALAIASVAFLFSFWGTRDGFRFVGLPRLPFFGVLLDLICSKIC